MQSEAAFRKIFAVPAGPLTGQWADLFADICEVAAEEGLIINEDNLADLKEVWLDKRVCPTP